MPLLYEEVKIRIHLYVIKFCAEHLTKRYKTGSHGCTGEFFAKYFCWVFKMFNVALASSGAQISLATSSDEKHQPENIIDGWDNSKTWNWRELWFYKFENKIIRNPNTFWATTGLFPQELIVSFQGLMNISSVKIECCSGNYYSFWWKSQVFIDYKNKLLFFSKTSSNSKEHQ